MIKDLFHTNRPTYSLEVFPPKKDADVSVIYDALDEFKTLFHELKIWVYEEKSVIKIFYDNDRGGSSFRSFQPLFWNFMVLWTLTPQQVR